MLRHVDICRKNGNQQRDETDTCGFSRRRDKNAQTTGDLRNATNHNQQCGIRQRWRNDALIEGGMHEVIGARRDKKHTE